MVNVPKLFLFITTTAALFAYGLFMFSLHLLYSLWLASVWASRMIEGLEGLL